ncbi:MAG: DNA polymerase III subunit alpha [Chromatiales bacterium]|nr:DNA polymerase III subunit alpha [Chromatiales bacterium]
MTPSFVHLRVHTEYSLVDGIVRVDELADAAAAAGMPAVAITDQCNLFALVKFVRAAERRGLKPIVGADLLIADGSDAPTRLPVLVQDRTGYLNLSELLTRAHRDGQARGLPIIAREWLHGHTDGLIALSGAREGDIAQAIIDGHPRQARRRLDAWRKLFGDRFYLEIQRTGRGDEAQWIDAAVELAVATQTPVVATNDVRFLSPDDFEAHEARVCINAGRTLADPRRPKAYTPDQFLRSPPQMAELFADLPEALENSVEIARRCNLRLELGKSVLPDFPVPADESLDGFVRAQAGAGLDRRLRVIEPVAPVEKYVERLRRELDVIVEMGFAGYFLIVADFINWARNNGVPVGPGRGSGAGSLVAYALGITDLDPLAYDLLFERFLNPERVSMPDFDVDFCMEGRDRVIDYVAQRYGRERVSQIITYGSMAARAVVRDVGRVLGHAYGYVDRIAKLVPFEIGMTLDKALEQSEDLRAAYDAEEEVQMLIDLARKLEGLARNVGKHAGGVVIAPSALTDFTPLYCEAGGANPVTQLDKDDVEAIGLVKFDFLGLRTLTVIDWAVTNLARRSPPVEVDIGTLTLDDPEVYALFSRAETTAVFQFESRGMKDYLRKLQPSRFDDLIALAALYRPGPLGAGMVDDYIERRHGRQEVVYPHPLLEPILEPTYGVIVYQEQVMQIAQVLAGYTLGGADLLRRAMGKKKPEEMAKQRSVFVDGATARGIDAQLASGIFDLMEKFAGYGFNKSHSAAYALVAYQTAWLKAHHPAAFMAAVLSADMDNTDKVVTLIDECRAMQLVIQPPDVNRSEYRFVVGADREIVYGLGAIKGVGQSAIEALLGERDRDGGFADLFELCRRVDLQKCNRRVLEALIRAGALDSIAGNRAAALTALDSALRSAEQHAQAADTGQSDLFGLPVEQETVAQPVVAEALPDHDDEDLRLAGERETLGLYLTGHPLDRCADELREIAGQRIADISVGPPADGGYTRRQDVPQVTIAGLAVQVRGAKTQRGEPALFLTLDDRSGRVEVAVFGELYTHNRDWLARDAIVVARGSVGVDEYSGGYRMRAESLMEFERAREAQARRLVVDLPADAGQAAQDLAGLLNPHLDGECEVRVRCRVNGARVLLSLDPRWRVRVCQRLLKGLRQRFGAQAVAVRYAPFENSATAKAGNGNPTAGNHPQNGGREIQPHF